MASRFAKQMSITRGKTSPVEAPVADMLLKVRGKEGKEGGNER